DDLVTGVQTCALPIFLLEARDTTWPLRIWARHLAEIRDRTVLESHLERWLSSFSAVPPHIALLIWAETLADELRPAADETWGQKDRKSVVEGKGERTG